MAKNKRIKDQRRSPKPIITSMINNNPLSVFKNKGTYRFTYQEQTCSINGHLIAMCVESEMDKLCNFVKDNITEDKKEAVAILAWSTALILGIEYKITNTVTAGISKC